MSFRHYAYLCAGLLWVVSASAPLHAQRPVRFAAADGITIHADLYAGGSLESSPLLLLFHQAGANGRSEYAEIVPRLLGEGFAALVVDLRSGGSRFGGENRTVAGLAEVEYGYCDAYADLEAALEWAKANGAGRIIAWGSSYSAALAVRLGAEHGADLDRVLAFSPASGEPMAGCDANAYSTQVTVPLLVLRPTNESEIPSVAAQLDLFRAAGASTHIARPGTHGSSMLSPSRVEGDVEATWSAVISFLRDRG